MSTDPVTHFAGKTVIEWNIGDPIPDPSTAIPRFSAIDGRGKDYVDGEEKFQAFIADPASKATTGIVFGMMSDAADGYGAEVTNILVEQREHFQQLTSLFIGNISFEESEISWIALDDVSPIFTAYPQLEHVHILGCASSYTDPGLHLGILHLEHLKTLIVETGSMDNSIVHDILRSHLPALEHLELWTGSEDYLANCTVEDFAPLFTDTLFPNLHYLGLRNSEIANDLASALSQSPLLERLRVLDLSLGLLDDSGASALLNCPAISKLEKLDIHHHYCSEEMVQRLHTLSIAVDTSDRLEPDLWDGEEHRYVAVSE
jgi:hypothetical protein